MVYHSYSTFRIGLCRYLHAVRQAERYIIVIQLETLVLIQLSGFDLCQSNSKGKRLLKKKFSLLPLCMVIWWGTKRQNDTLFKSSIP